MIGKQLKDRYDIIEEIGTGGMATVYLAYCNYLKRNVAIKVLHSSQLKDQDDILISEAKAIARVSHANIVQVYDIFDEGGKTFIVMEYIKGITLKDKISRVAPLPEDEIITVGSKLASALSNAHSNGVIHRDIKPENIIIDTNGEPKLTDFGIAHVSNEFTIVRSDQIFGSLRYSSPEQLKGNIVDERSDIYSLGVVLYEMATGTMPFPDESPVTAAFRKLKEPLPAVTALNPRISKELERIILTATAIDPAARFHSMLEFYSSLQKIKELPVIVPRYVKKNDTASTTTNGNQYDDRSHRPLWFGMLFGLLATAILLVMALGNQASKVADVRIPDVTGQVYQSAMKTLNAKGLYAEIVKLENSSTIPSGTVITQAEKAETLIKHGETVHLTVSKGVGQIPVPDFIYLNEEEARKLAGNFELKLVITRENHESAMVDKVFEQSILRGEMVDPGTEITVKISDGPSDQMTIVPDVEGFSLAQATTILSNSKLYPEVTEQFSDVVEQGKVIRQTPQAGETILEDAKVNLILSKGRQNPPTTEPVKPPVTPPPTTDPETSEPVLMIQMKLSIPYTDIIGETFSVRVTYAMDGQVTEAYSDTDKKHPDLTAYETLVALPKGSSWAVYINNNTRPTQTGTVQ